MTTTTEWASSVILVDAEFLDRLAFDFTVNFERMIGRRINKGDLCHWLDCIALDGGLRPGANNIQALFLHPKEKTVLDNFVPSDFAAELDGKAFTDNLGEFLTASISVENVTSMADLFTQSLTAIISAEKVKRIMVVADIEAYGAEVKRIIAASEGKDITLFTMEPTAVRRCSQEILGYSLMAALGIEAAELPG